MSVSVYRDNGVFHIAGHYFSAERIACARYNSFYAGYGHYLQFLQRHSSTYLNSRF